MGDKTDRYPVLLQWDQGPEELKKVKNKIQKYFQTKSESSGGECEIRDTDCTRGYFLICFKDKEAQQRVLQKNPHKVPLQDRTLLVNVFPDAENAQSMGIFPSSSAASNDDDGASGSPPDKDHQQEDNRSPEIPKRGNSSMTDSTFRNGDSKKLHLKGREDSTGLRESQKDRRGAGAPEGEEQDHISSTRRSSENEDNGPEESAESRNESGKIRRQLSKEGRSHPPEGDGASGPLVDQAPKPFMPNNSYPFTPHLLLPVTVNRQRIDDPVLPWVLPSQTLRNNGAPGSSADTEFFGTVTSPLHGVHEMKIGSVTYQVKIGDIIKEKTDVIVNSSNQDFTRYSGVSKAILDAAGPPIASSAAALGSRPHKGYVITGSGRLRQLIWILHVTGPTDPTSTKKIVLDVLQECENLQVSSVTFPALGTGAGGLAASTVADSILDGLVDFIKTESVRSLQTVKVVLFQQRMLNDFYTSMKKREGTPLSKAKSSLTRLSDGDSLRLPSHWKPMGETRVMEVDVPPGSPEYFAVQLKFQKSCRNQIVKILRVQNRDLWLQYQIKKQNIDSQNGSTTNEKELFHGTDVNSIQNVNHKGFNRSYAGRHAAAYGNGTYFAVNANYSATETYSNPDGNGRKHMYLARVLTGLYCVGRQGMKAPPAKNTANPTDCYDSVTDNVQNPSMFVIFNDVQAYPEYHIVFQ